MPEIENDAARSGTFLRSRAGRPTGVIPRNAQAMMIVGISAVMVAAIAFSGPQQDRREACAPAQSRSHGSEPGTHRRVSVSSRRGSAQARGGTGSGCRGPTAVRERYRGSIPKDRERAGAWNGVVGPR